MMYYCEFSEDKNLIYGFNQSRTVGRYLIVDRDSVPGQVGYMARTIVTVTPNSKDLYWYKHTNIDKQSVMLTKEEQQELMLQILKSENW